MKSLLVVCTLVVMAGALPALLDEVPKDGEVADDLNHFDARNLTDDEQLALDRELMESTRRLLENPDLYQGDILLTEEQKRALEERKVIANSALWWPAAADGYVYVNYRFATPTIAKTLVLQAINTWQAETCVRFTDIQSANGKPHLVFQNDNSGCNSFVGRQSNMNGQPVNLAPGCLTEVNTPIHEIGHALGFEHEHNRSDRDNFVYVVLANVQPGLGYAFDKAVTNNFNIPYDYSSVMQYYSTAFSVNNKETMVAKEPFGQLFLNLNTLNNFSFMDKRIANLQYKCIALNLKKCGVAADPCKNYGYFGTSCKCVCPPGTSGTSCETLNQPYLQALVAAKYPRSKTIVAEGRVTSTGYPSPIAAKDEYIQLIKAPACKKVRLTFTAFKLTQRATDKTCYPQQLTIRKNNNLVIASSYCASEIAPGQVIESEGTTMVLHFKSFTTAPSPGYSATITFVPQASCTGR
ncbi:protein SpAN [Hyalella azteca]|uniref:Metalloendopeptidase n=1 Tax=Hyalella azteca TaxID=294128 RepID=A0A8B7NCN5_HYAAZ|nr:protein SpAN [Hyalella azteca]